jgi:hypothetical protein
MVCLAEPILWRNPNACLAHGKDVLAALPTRAIRDTMNGNYTNFFDFGMADPVYAVSHKLWAGL